MCFLFLIYFLSRGVLYFDLPVGFEISMYIEKEAKKKEKRLILIVIRKRVLK